MPLDLTTLYAVAAMGTLIAGGMHLIPWATGRFDRWAAYWGFGHLLLGVAAVAGIVHDQLVAATWVVRLGNPVAIWAYMLMLAGMRAFERPDSRVAPLFGIAALLCTPLLLSVDPADYGLRVAYFNTLRAIADAAIMLIAIRLARQEHVQTAWIVVALFAATAPLFVGRAYLALMGQVGTKPTGVQVGLAAWLAAGQISFVIFRAFSLLILQAERAQKALAEQICRDPLTGALNRLGFERLIATLAGPVGMMVIDIDHFKQLNDRHGHLAGDAALRQLAAIAQDVLGEEGELVRWGGDEFICVLPAGDGERALILAQAIAARFAVAVRTALPDYPEATISIGHATGPIDGMIDDLLARADTAMYVAKRNRPPAPYFSAA